MVGEEGHLGKVDTQFLGLNLEDLEEFVDMCPVGCPEGIA